MCICPASDTDQAMGIQPLEWEGENDYSLKEGHNSVWLTVGNKSLHIINRSKSEPVKISVYHRNKEMEDALYSLSINKDGNIEIL